MVNAKDLQKMIISLDNMNNSMELLILALEQPEATTEHAVSNISILKNELEVIINTLDKIFEAADGEEEGVD